MTDVKLTKFACKRSDDLPSTKTKAELVLRTKAAEAFGDLWPRVEDFYEVAHGKTAVGLYSVIRPRSGAEYAVLAS